MPDLLLHVTSRTNEKYRWAPARALPQSVPIMRLQFNALMVEREQSGGIVMVPREISVAQICKL
jgi:hypothetical protein